MANEIKIGISAHGADVAARGLNKVSTSMKGTATAAGGLKAAAVGLQSAIAPLLAVFAAFKGATALTGFFGSAVEAYKTQELAARGATDAQKKWASEFQQAVGVGDEVTLALMRQAKQMGISEDRINDMISASAGLSEVLGTDLESAFRKVMQATEGNADALSEYIPGLKDLATNEEKFAKISEVAKQGLDQKRESMTQLIGVQQRATNSWGDMLEMVGEIIAPFRTLISQGIAVAAELLQQSLTPALGMARKAMENIKPAMDFVTKAVVGGITAIEVVLTNLPEIWKLNVAMLKLSWVEFVEDLKHGFTVQLPQLIAWLGDNWQNIFRDMFSSTMTIAQNWFTNFGDMAKAAWDFIASGMQGGLSTLAADLSSIASRNLLEGFEATTQALPELIERSLTDEEQALKDTIGQLGSGLSDEFNSKFQNRMKSLIPGIETPGIGGLGSAGGGSTDSLGGRAASVATLQAQESRLLTRGTASDPQEQIAKTAEEQLKVAQLQQQATQELKTLMQRLVDKPTLQLEVAT